MSSVVERLGWMLIHSAWEDLLIWGLLQVMLVVLAQKTAQARYATACLALLAMAAVPWMTFDVTDLSARMNAAIPVEPGAPVIPLRMIAPQPEITPLAQPGIAAIPAFSEASPSHSAIVLLVAAWTAGLFFFSLRLAWQWSRVRKLVHGPWRPLPAPWPERLAILAQRAGIRRAVQLGETAALRVPVVARWLKPVILLPLGLVTTLSTEQVEMILRHELAHIARHDFAVNLLQRVIETVFFYHPAVWSVSRRIRQERELACDDLAVAWSENPHAYAEALAACEDFRQEEPLLAATGGDLLARVERVLGTATRDRRGPALAAAAGIAGVGLYLSSMLLAPMLAAQVMSPAERVAKIQALQPPPPAELPVLPDANVEVMGTLAAEDTGALPVGLDKVGPLKHSQVSANNGGLTVTRVDLDDLKKRHFQAWARTGSIQLGLWFPGYAPYWQAAFKETGGELKMDAVIKRGFPGRVRIVGPTGEPVEGAKLTATFCPESGGVSLSIPADPVISNAEGLSHFGEVLADSPIQLTVLKDGWQMATKTVNKWDSEAPLTWQIRPARSTAGRVIDAATGQPIAHAQISLASRRPLDASTDETFDVSAATPLGETDAQGRFDLRMLDANESCRIYIGKAGYPYQSFPIKYGEQDRVCELPRGLRLAGKILDPNGVLAASHLPISLQLSYALQATPFNGFGNEIRLPLPKLGPEIPFSFNGVPQGRIGLAFADYGLEKYQYDLTLQKDTTDYVIDLRQPPREANEDLSKWPTRAVEISFQGASTPVNGTLKCLVASDRPGQTWEFEKSLTVREGKARADFPVPTRIALSADQISGYWFVPQTIEVPAESTKLEHQVSLVGAGIVHGHITVPERLRHRTLSVHVAVVSPPPGMRADQFSNMPEEIIRRVSLDGDYVSPSLPFGGKYLVVLDAAPIFLTTGPVAIDAVHAVERRDFDLGRPGGTLRGRLVGADHNAESYRELMLTYHPTSSTNIVCPVGATDGQGNFALSDIHFEVPGDYEIGPLLPNGGWEQNAQRIDGRTPQPVEIPTTTKAPNGAALRSASQPTQNGGAPLTQQPVNPKSNAAVTVTETKDLVGDVGRLYHAVVYAQTGPEAPQLGPTSYQFIADMSNNTFPVTRGSVSLPAGSAWPVNPVTLVDPKLLVGAHYLYVQGFPSEAALLAKFPYGTYAFNIQPGPNGPAAHTAPVQSSGTVPYPPIAPVITNKTWDSGSLVLDPTSAEITFTNYPGATLTWEIVIPGPTYIMSAGGGGTSGGSLNLTGLLNYGQAYDAQLRFINRDKSATVDDPGSAKAYGYSTMMAKIVEFRIKTPSETGQPASSPSLAPSYGVATFPSSNATGGAMADLIAAMKDHAPSIQPTGQSLQVLQGFYGADGSWRDVTPFLQKLVKGGRLQVSWQQPYTEIGGDPAWLRVKTLIVSYRLNGEIKLTSFEEENPPVGLQASLP